MLQGKVILVTGGTRGIGAAVSRLCVEQGARVFAWYRQRGDEAKALEAAVPGLETRPVDVTDAAAVRGAMDELTAAAGGLDGLVNGAGLARDALFAAMEDDDWQAVVRTNLDGVYHVCRAAVRELIFRRGGRIVNLASLSGVTGLPGQAAYAASKAGVVGLTKTLALELGRYGILVNAVSPGLIETEMTGALPDQRRRALLDRIPLGRFGVPEDVARIVVFLLSDWNRYLTGQNLVVSGGLYT